MSIPHYESLFPKFSVPSWIRNSHYHFTNSSRIYSNRHSCLNNTLYPSCHPCLIRSQSHSSSTYRHSCMNCHTLNHYGPPSQFIRIRVHCVHPSRHSCLYQSQSRSSSTYLYKLPSQFIRIWVQCVHSDFIISVYTDHTYALSPHIVIPIWILTYSIATDNRPHASGLKVRCENRTSISTSRLTTFRVIPFSTVHTPHITYSFVQYICFVSCTITSLRRPPCAHSQHSLCHFLPNSIAVDWTPTNSMYISIASCMITTRTIISVPLALIVVAAHATHRHSCLHRKTFLPSPIHQPSCVHYVKHSWYPWRFTISYWSIVHPPFVRSSCTPPFTNVTTVFVSPHSPNHSLTECIGADILHTIIPLTSFLPALLWYYIRMVRSYLHTKCYTHISLNIIY